MRSRFWSAAPTILFATLAAISLSVGVMALGRDAATPNVDQQSRNLLEQAGRYIRGLQGFSVTIDTQISVTLDGKSQTTSIVQKLQAERPNRLAATLTSPVGNGAFACDGKEFAGHIAPLEKYLVVPSPADWGAILQNQLAIAILSPGNSLSVIEALVADDPATRLLSHAKSAHYGGEVMLDDVKCHLIEAKGKDFDWSLWIEVGDKPVIRRFVPDVQGYVERATPAGTDAAARGAMKVTNVVAFNDWQANPKFTAETFAFTPPKGMEKTTSLAALMASETAVLVGKPAPPIKLSLVGGGTLDLESYTKKNIVILDFWATWCGPCREAMPTIAKVAAKFKDKGVLLFAVNLGESADAVTTFSRDTGINIKFALDEDMSVARAYAVSSIPQTVIVGKNGIVQAVHVGHSDSLEEELTKELNALVAGKNLAAEPKKKPDDVDDATLDKK